MAPRGLMRSTAVTAEAAGASMDELLITVHGDWRGWRSASIRLSDLRNVHWFQPQQAPRPLLHGYISCSDIVEGEIEHRCSQTRRPHRLRVCVLKRHALPSAYAMLARQADRAPHDRSAVEPLPAAGTRTLVLTRATARQD